MTKSRITKPTGGVHLKLSHHDRECLFLAVNFWLENVRQEDTDQETYLTLVDLRDTIEITI